MTDIGRRERDTERDSERERERKRESVCVGYIARDREREKNSKAIRLIRLIK